MGAARTLFEKVWASHVVRSGPGGHDLLYVDRHLVHEGSFHAFERLRETGRRVRRRDLTFATADHYVPTAGSGVAIGDPIRAFEVRRLTETPWVFPAAGDPVA